MPVLHRVILNLNFKHFFQALGERRKEANPGFPTPNRFCYTVHVYYCVNCIVVNFTILQVRNNFDKKPDYPDNISRIGLFSFQPV
jgi:hypothetical protein